MKSLWVVVWLLLLTTVSHAASLLVMNSGPGDYIGAAQLHVITPLDANFSAAKNYHEGVNINLDGGALNSWTVSFAAPQHVALTPGAYELAERFPFQSPTKPGLSISGAGRGCNTLTGRFVVREVTYGIGDAITSFAADFEQHCEGGTAVLYGSVVFAEGDATCASANDGTPCNDQNACTGNDACLGGLCKGTNVSDGTTCDDAASATSNDACTSGACVAAFATTTTTTVPGGTTTTTLPGEGPCHGDTSLGTDAILRTIKSRVAALQKRAALLGRRRHVADACRTEIDEALQGLQDQIDAAGF